VVQPLKKSLLYSYRNRHTAMIAGGRQERAVSLISE